MGNDGPDYSNVAAGGQVNVTHPLHVEQHENGGEDEINLEGLSGSPADVGDASEATLAELKDRIGDETNPATGTSNKQLADILTELGVLLTELKLKADLTETQPVSAASLPLPSTAATSTAQAIMVTALQSIQNLVGALHDVGVDELDVVVKTMPIITVKAGGGDKIFSFENIVEESVENLDLSVGVNDLIGTSVDTGKMWRLTILSIELRGTAPTRMYVTVQGLATAVGLLDENSPAGHQIYTWQGDVYMQAGDYIRCRIEGTTAGDAGILRYAGLGLNAP